MQRYTLVLATVLLIVTCKSEPELKSNPQAKSNISFPAANPGSVGIAPDSLVRISNLMNHWVSDSVVVGAEVLIIKNSHTAYHETFGLRNLEAGLPFEKNTVCEIKSMTKPVVGMAIFMLEEANKLKLSDKISDHLELFNTEKSKDITIYQMLTHTAGFGNYPGPLPNYSTLEQMVVEIAEKGPEYPIGPYRYSSADVAALGYLIQVLSGISVEEFIQTKILNPLEMHETYFNYQTASAHPRFGPVYSKKDGSFNPDEYSSQVKIFRGGGGLFSTTTDYAKFLSYWMNSQQKVEQQLISAENVRTALTPTDQNPGYACLWQIFEHSTSSPLPEFGHRGSLGTVGWAFPDQDLLVLYYVQTADGFSAISKRNQSLRNLVVNVLGIRE